MAWCRRFKIFKVVAEILNLKITSLLLFFYGNMSLVVRKPARGLKFRILKVEGLHYLCSENKGAD